MTDAEHDIAETRRMTNRIAEIGHDDFFALASCGFAMASLLGEHEKGADLIDQALALNPNASLPRGQIGFVKCWLGEPELAIHHFQCAIRNLSLLKIPFDHEIGLPMKAMADDFGHSNRALLSRAPVFQHGF